MTGDELHDRHAQLPVEEHERCTVADVLPETAHIGRQGLVGVVFRRIDRDVAVELRPDPVIDTAHIIDQPCRANVGAAREPQREGHVAIQLERPPRVNTDDKQVKGFAFETLVVFGEEFQLGAAPKVRVKFLGSVKDILQLRTRPYVTRIASLKRLVVERGRDIRLVTALERQPHTVGLVERELQRVEQAVVILLIDIATHLRADGLPIKRNLSVQTTRQVLVAEHKLVCP